MVVTADLLSEMRSMLQSGGATARVRIIPHSSDLNDEWGPYGRLHLAIRLNSGQYVAAAALGVSLLEWLLVREPSDQNLRCVVFAGQKGQFGTETNA